MGLLLKIMWKVTVSNNCKGHKKTPLKTIKATTSTNNLA